MNNLLVLGCAPRPQPIKIPREMGFNTLGVEPDALYIQAVQEYLGSPESVTIGATEDIPLEDESQHLGFFYLLI